MAPVLRGNESLAAWLAIIFSAVCMVFWVCAFQQQHWIMKKNAYYRLSGGLWEVELKKGYLPLLVGTLVEPMTTAGLSFMTALLEKDFDLQEFREYMCALPKIPNVSMNLCEIWQFVQLATWGMIGGVAFSFLFLTSGASLVYWYVFVRARSVVRKWMHIAFAIAPLFQLGPLAVYIFAAFQVQDMYPRVQGAALGHSIVFAGTACIVSMVPLFIVHVFLGRSMEEEYNEAFSEHKKLTKGIEEDIAAYGSVPGQPPAPAGQAPLMQQTQLGFVQPGADVTMGPYSGSALSADPQYAQYASPEFTSPQYSSGDYLSAGAAPGYDPMQPSGWESQPAELRRGATYMPAAPPEQA